MSAEQDFNQVPGGLESLQTSIGRFELNSAAVEEWRQRCGLQLPEGIVGPGITLSPERPFEVNESPYPPHSPLTWPVYSRVGSAGVTLYVGHAIDALQAQSLGSVDVSSPSDRLGRVPNEPVESLLDLSSRLVEALSNWHDLRTMGRLGLQVEESQVTRRSERVARVWAGARAAGVAAIGGVLLGGIHERTPLPTFLQGVLGVVVAGLAVAASTTWVDTAIRQILRKNAYKDWPADRRAGEHSWAYRAARSRGEIGELVTFVSAEEAQQ